MNREERSKLAFEHIRLLDSIETPKGYLYNREDWESFNLGIGSGTGYIEVTNETTLQALLRLRDRRVCALNFASANNPGGGFQSGSKAQEEDLALTTSLYSSLNQFIESFYAKNKRECNGYYTDSIIMSENVTVLRDTDYNLLDIPFNVGIISSPAVNIGRLRDEGIYNSSKVKEVMENRCCGVLNIAIKHRYRNIVLGAWGCGVFGNKPEDIARIFRDVLYKKGYRYYFDTIVFACMDKKSVFWNTLDRRC